MGGEGGGVNMRVMNAEGCDGSDELHSSAWIIDNNNHHHHQ